MLDKTILKNLKDDVDHIYDTLVIDCETYEQELRLNMEIRRYFTERLNKRCMFLAGEFEEYANFYHQHKKIKEED